LSLIFAGESRNEWVKEERKEVENKARRRRKEVVIHETQGRDI